MLYILSRALQLYLLLVDLSLSAFLYRFVSVLLYQGVGSALLSLSKARMPLIPWSYTSSHRDTSNYKETRGHKDQRP